MRPSSPRITEPPTRRCSLAGADRWWLAGLLSLASIVMQDSFFFSSAAPAEAAGPPPSQPHQFRAGAAASNITPALGTSMNGYFNDRAALQIHDELHARCLVLDDGQTRLALVLCDSCMLPRDLLEAARGRLQQRTGLAPGHILIAATHTHTAPTCLGIFQSEPDAGYVQFLTARIADGIERAIRNLAPAKIAWGTGQRPDLVFNRRWRMKPGTIPPNPFGGTNDLVQMNPPIASANLVEPAGPTDPEVSVLSVLHADGRPLAVLANYSLHYVGTEADHEISADYFGAFAERMGQLLGTQSQDPPFVALLSNGTSGDINNINFRARRERQAPYARVRAVADALAGEVQRVCQKLQYQGWVPLGVVQREIQLGTRRPSEAEVARARSLLARAQGRALRTAEEIYARETDKMKDWPAQAPVLLQVWRIGDLGIAAIPCEVFAETGLAIKAQSPFKPTFTIELANGATGYLPPPRQHQLGGYETWRARSSFLEVDAEPKILEALLALLAQLRTGAEPAR